MGFHFEESAILSGSIDNRTKGTTVIRIDFANWTSSLITLQGNPARDLAGSQWKFENPYARRDEEAGPQCFFIPALCEGRVGRISYSRKSEVPVLPPDEHYDQLFDDDQEDPPLKTAPVLELEWFSPKFGQVEIDCQMMTLELIEMAWTLGVEEAAREEAEVEELRADTVLKGEEQMADVYDQLELIDEFVAEEVEPHELEEHCFLILQDFITNSADGSADKQTLRGDLIKLQEQMATAFSHHAGDGTFDDERETAKLLTGVLPFLDRALATATKTTPSTATHLLGLRESIVELRDELSRP